MKERKLDSMEREKSCGAVIFREENTRRYYLVLKSTQGHTTLCKGHVEGDETEHETAAREILEETGLTADIDTGFRRTVTFYPKPGVVKDVVFFTARMSGGREHAQEMERLDLCLEEYVEYQKSQGLG